MKLKTIFTIILFSILLMGVGCKKSTSVVLLPSAVNDLQTQPVPENSKQKISTSTISASAELSADAKSQLTARSTLLYRGSWFDIEYPKEFTATPLSPITKYKGDEYIQSDEARFISPDGSVEFFIFSPLWGGDPANYLTVAPVEHIISDTTKEDDGEGGEYDKKIIRWVTLQSNDNSYYRSYVSIKEQVGSGSDIHHVFGIKYSNNDVYNKYRNAYISFKESLRQFAD